MCTTPMFNGTLCGVIAMLVSTASAQPSPSSIADTLIASAKIFSQTPADVESYGPGPERLLVVQGSGKLLEALARRGSLSNRDPGRAAEISTTENEILAAAYPQPAAPKKADRGKRKNPTVQSPGPISALEGMQKIDAAWDIREALNEELTLYSFLAVCSAEQLTRYRARASKASSRLQSDWQKAQTKLSLLEFRPSIVLLGIIVPEPFWNGDNWIPGYPQRAIVRLNSLTSEAVTKWADVARLNSALAAANSLVAVDALFVNDAFAASIFEGALPAAQKQINALVPVGFNLLGKKLPVVVTVTGYVTTVSDAKIVLRRAASFEETGGLWVTNAVSPPGSGQVKPTKLEWKSMREVELLDWYAKVGALELVKARVTSTDGSTREVFLWKQGAHLEEYYSLGCDDIKIVGRVQTFGSSSRDGEVAPGVGSTCVPFKMSWNMPPL